MPSTLSAPLAWLQIEEGHSIAQLAHVWHVVVRHHTLFQSYYPQFVTQIVGSLPKLGLSSSATLEHKLLAVGASCSEQCPPVFDRLLSVVCPQSWPL